MTASDRAGRLEVTWARDGLLAWQPAASRTGGNLRTTMSGSFAGDGPWSHTTIAQVRLPFGTLQVIGQHIAPEAFVTMGHIADDVSDSLRWFAAARDAAIDLVRAGQVVPVLGGSAARKWQATWRPVAGAGAQIAAELGAAMPPVCAAAFVIDAPDSDGAALATEVLERFVDVATRAVLRATGWRPDIGTMRSPAASAVRALGRALSDFVDLAPVGNEAVNQELAIAADALDRIGRRVGGLPVVVARLRLALPDEPDGAWPVDLELVDADDRSRWCTVADVAARAPAALALVANADHAGRGIEVLAATAEAAAERLAALLPGVVDALIEPEPAVDVEQAAEVLEHYDAVRAAGIEVLVPEQLARRRPQVRATAAPTAGGDGRFGVAAMLDWQLVVDDTSIDDLALERAAAQATTLLEVGGRWVRLEGADVRRALAAVAEHREEHGEVSVLGLLRLAAELEEQAASTDEQDPAAVVAAPDGWLADLLDGLPDTSLRDGEVPVELAATLRPYQRRGLGWLQFLSPARPRRVPRRRHGAGQDRAAARPPRRARRAAPRAVPAVGRAQLAAGGGPLRAPRPAAGAARHGPPARRRAARRGGRGRPRRHDLPVGDARHRGAVHRRVDHGGARRGPGGEERPHPRGARGPAAAGPAADRAHRHARSRTGSASCGRSSTSSPPACWARRPSSASASPRRSNGARTRRPRRRCAGSPPRSCCAAPRPTSRSCPICRTRSSRSPGPR